MYLETILILTSQKPTVRAVDVSEYMGFSKPSVSRALGLLKKEEFIAVDDDGHITLTASGRTTAETIYARHRVLTELLIRMGVNRETAAADACRMEHAISDVTFRAIQNYMQQ